MFLLFRIEQKVITFDHDSLLIPPFLFPPKKKREEEKENEEGKVMPFCSILLEYDFIHSFLFIIDYDQIYIKLKVPININC